MSQSMQDEGKKLIREGERILRRDVQSALDERDFNITVRRAQEAVEFVLKGALKSLGTDYPKVHDVGPVFSEQARQKLGAADTKALQRIEEISLWLGQARAPSFYFEREYGEEDAQKAFEDAGFVLTETKKMLGIEG